ncbi:MAG: CRTAC1 family protein [Planctomycetota bacterium]
MSEDHEREESFEGELVAGDDTVILRALKVSAFALAAILALVAVVFFLLRPEQAEDKVDEKPIVLPKVQDIQANAPQVAFSDVTAAAGIDFVHFNGATGEKLLPETMGSGCAFFDFDLDGDQDLLLVNAMSWPGDVPGDPAPTLRLYSNDGKGSFKDVTVVSGLAVTVYGMGAAVGDYDNDGKPDLFITTVNENRLFRNLGGRFEDVTAAAGVAGGNSTWSSSAGFFDCDNDGDLDLFVCNYISWSRKIDTALDYRLTGVGRAYGPPTNFEGTQPYFYLNNGDGTFVESAEKAGLQVLNRATGKPVAKALALIPFDFNSDGNIDLFVANDTVRNFLYVNKGGGVFEEAGEEAGVAYDGTGNSTGAMGVDVGYYRDDDSVGLGVGNFANEMSSLYVSEDGQFFSDEAIGEGIGPVSRQMLSFGLFFFDYDLDGRLDLLQTNGHLEEEINKVQPSQHYRQPSQLFWNCGTGFKSCFVPVDEKTTGDMARPVVGRAAAYADIDGDGDLDCLITQTGDRPLLLRNDQGGKNGWLRLKLVGRRCNRDAIGASVTLLAAGATMRQQVMPSRSYLSQVETVLTFGLGSAKRVDEVRILWPGGKKVQVVKGLDAGKVHRIEQE